MLLRCERRIRGCNLPPIPRKPVKFEPIIKSGPGRPAPIKKQPLPAYGPYKLPLTDAEKRIVISKRTPKYIETPSGRIATGGGGVGFFTKGDKSAILGRVRERAMQRDAAIRDREAQARTAEMERLSKPVANPALLKRAVAEDKKNAGNTNFLESLASDVGLDDFYRDNVLPTVGRVVGQVFENAKQTYGASILAPGLNIARTAADAAGVEDKIDKPFDYAADLVKGGVGIAKTQGFDRAKPYVKTVVDGASKLGKGGVEAVGKVDDFLQTEVPVYDSAKTWADRNAVQPSKDAAVEVLSRITGQPINHRIDKADEFDRNFIYQANDITQRGTERETAAPQERRDVWMQMALGEFDDPAWKGYKSPFSREQLQNMSDYELANAAYGTHTNVIASLFEAAKNDLKKIGAMPAAIGALTRQIQDANDKGDYRGLGNMAEFLVRQGVSNMVALSQANLYVMTGGKAGNYQDLVRALQAEPILTSLDVASTATLYGKAATLGFKTGGALSKAGAIASRVPGAVRAGEAIAGKASKLAYGERLGAPLARGVEGPSGIVGAPTLGAPLRAAATAGKGLRKIADVEEVQVRDPALAAIGDVAGVTIGADRTFRPSSSIFSKSASLLRKRLYEGTNPISRAIYKRGEVADASKFRAIASAVVEELGTERAAPVVKAFKDIFDEDPNVALRVMWDLSGSESFKMPEGLGGRVVDLTPGKRADELESVLAGQLWVRRGDKSGEDAFRFSDVSPGDGWANVVTKKPKGMPKGSVIKLSKIEKANIEQSILLLRKIDDLPEDVVARAKERLDAPYREQFGETIGKRIGGRNAPEGALTDVLQLQELQNMRSLDRLGVKIDPRVADISPSVQSRLSERFGIGKPTGIGRRDVAGVARLQDETIARLMPLVGDEFRAEIEKILAEQKFELSKRLVDLENKKVAIEKAKENLSEFVDNIDELDAEISLLQEKLGALNSENPEVVQLTHQEAWDFASKAADFWKKLYNKYNGGPGSADAPTWKESPVTSPGIVLGTKTGDATGSNTSGVSGFWTGIDGIKRYVKQYADRNQAVGEVIANEIYRRLDTGAPVSSITSKYSDDTQFVANDIIDVYKFDESSFDPDEIQKLSEKVVDRIVADLWLANWDAVGVGGENIGITVGTNIPVRLDQGGALFHRAQGELKTNEQLDNFSIEDFVTQNPNYKSVINNAGYEKVADIESLGLQLLAIHKLIDDSGGLSRFVDDLTNDLDVSQAYKSNLYSLLEKRLAVLDEQIKISDDDLALWKKSFAKSEETVGDIGDENLPTLTPAQVSSMKSSLNWYMGSGYWDINTALRGSSPINSSVQRSIDNIDTLFDLTPVTEKPMVLFRGIGATSAYDDIQAGEIIADKGFLSTSFKPTTAEGFGGSQGPKGIVLEIYLPEGSKAVYGHGAAHENTGTLSTSSFAGGENEVILPRGTEFYITDVVHYESGAKLARVYAITPGSKFSIEDIPEFGGTKQKGMIEQALPKKLEKKALAVQAKKTIEDTSNYESIVADLENAKREYKAIDDAQKDIDMITESLMRDVIESGAIPTGARVHIPTLGSPKGAKKTVLPKEALAGRGRPRDMLNIYTGQFALLGSTEDLQRFSGALARNLRIPFVAFESVTRFTDYLMRTGTTIKFAEDKAVFKKQKADLLEAGIINGNGELGSDYVILPVNEQTGFLDADSFAKLDFKKAEEVGTKGRSDAGVDDAQISLIFEKALNDNAFDNLDSIKPGTRVVIVSKKRLDSLKREMAAAAETPGLLRRITRQWVRFTLTTLPRTPIANIAGSGLLSALGGGLGGYPEAMRIIRRGNAPPELLNNGFAGMFDEGGDLVVSPEGGRFQLAQRYMNYIYYYNVMGEDLARLSVFMQSMKRGLKDPKTRAKIDAELKEVMDLNDSFQTLLDAVARGEFANGKALTPELVKIRDTALQKADDFLGGARGLTSRQRLVTTAVPFWMWYKHIFKLYFYTLPFKYPGRSLTMNAMARLGAEESARNGFYDSFYEDAIKVGEEAFGSNIYSKGLATNIFPFNFGGVLEYDEGAPGVQFALSNIAPTITVPARLAGIGVPGAPIIGAGGERLKPGDVFAPGYAEAAVSEAEKLFAPLGLAQSTLAPRSSLTFDAYRLATGQPLPEAQQRGEGEQYAVTPRGAAGVGLPQSVLDMFMRSFGLNVVRTPVRGPVAERRIRDEQARLEEEARKRYRESLGLNY